MTSSATRFNQWLQADGSVWLNFYYSKTGYLLDFPGLCVFEVSADGTEITSRPAPGISPETVQHLHLNQVLPLAWSRQFKLVFHGGAVEIGDAAIAFLGSSGRGKSTLTSSFATNGYRFLTDDGLFLEKHSGYYIAYPSHPSLRLWDDSRHALMPQSTQAAPPLDYSPKWRLLANDNVIFCSSPRRINTIYLLGEGNTDRVSIQPMLGRDVIMGLVGHSFLLDIDERAILSHHFRQLNDLVNLIGVYRLDYPRRYECLPVVREAIIEHVLRRA